MKYVYILEIGQLNDKKKEFFFYDMEVYSSWKSVQKVVGNMIECNNGYGIQVDDNDKKKDGSTGFRRGEVRTVTFTYNCVSAPDGDRKGVSMRLRYVVRKMKINLYN